MQRINGQNDSAGSRGKRRLAMVGWVAAGAFIATLAGFAASAAAATNVLFILDSSGSMWERVDGVPKTVTAKRVLTESLGSLPADARVGLMTYGHRRKGDCGDIELLSPVGAESRDAIAKKVNALQPKGETPIAAALELSASAFKNLSGDRNLIVLVTDGAEECHGDPCAAAKKLAAAGFDVHINVVGFNLQKKERDAVECIAREGKGKYYDAKDAKSLAAAMVEVKTEVAQAPAAAPTPPPAPPKPAELNLLSPAQGGQLVIAPSAAWQTVIDGKDADTLGLGGCNSGIGPMEAIFAFKDEKPATFAKFLILIPAAGSWVKDFELLAADDAPNGTFRSLGKFATLNALAIKSPYQEFTFPETTAKYLKLKLLSVHGGCPPALTQIRLIGKPAEQTAAAAAPAPVASTAVNLLSPAQGGQLLVAPSAAWQAVISGKEGDSLGLGGCNSGISPMEAVFAFKDEKPATFSKFTILIPSAGSWVKEFEVLAADDSPTGTFRSLGQFATQNALAIKSPHQEFAFPETTAKYVKLRLLSVHGGCPPALTQIQLLGKPAAEQAGAAAPAASPAPTATTLVNILSPAQGGQLLVAPSADWQAAISGKDGDSVGLGGCNSGISPMEAIFAFKDEKPAAFSKFAILIPSTGSWVKDFEVLAADDAPTGTFRSLGQFATQNLLSIKSPYQEFGFPETTAKYFKLKLLSVHGGCPPALTQIRVMGKPGG